MSLKELLQGWYGDDLPSHSRDLWLELDPWPLSTNEHVFLAQAVQGVGEALFPSEWTGLEPVQSFLPILDSSPFLSNGDAASYAVNILGRFRPEFKLGPVLDFSLHDRPLSLEEMDAAVEAYLAQEAAPNARATQMFRAVQRVILTAAASGQLKTFRRRVERAVEFVTLDKSLWISAEAERRFAFCLMSEFDPYSDVVVPWPIWEDLKASANSGNKLRFTAAELCSAYPSYVYVSRSDLTQLCFANAAIADPGPNASEDPKQPQRPPALIKQDIAALLKTLISKWRQADERASGKVPVRTFIGMVTAPTSTDRIEGAKPFWAREIWTRDAPEKWKFPGPSVDR